MFTRLKVVWIASALCVAVALGASLLLRVVPVRPGAAIQTAQNFVDCLRAHDLEQAYRLTIQRGEVGSRPEEFQAFARRQWPGTEPASVRFLEVRPVQSYGSRLRRWLRGQALDPAELHLEFSVDGVPFEVRETREENGGWRVNYFQSHAG